MSQIHVLDKHTAELIAAGEVVERPASAIKELCENSIDAGAKNIVVTIERGGILFMQIQDDGSGIEPEFVATAFLRHATSKVRTQDDLDNINTLGFRGEALASISAVGKVELLTKTKEAEFASEYKIYGGVEQGLAAAARPVGTTITVRDLFYNTPARMKFLKKDASEGTFVTEIVSQLALSHPEISFKLVRDNKVIFHTSGDGKALSAIYEILGRDFAKDLLEINYSNGNYSVKGYITQPKACRQSRSMQYFFINGRFVKNRTMMAALEAAYKNMVMTGKFPGGVIALDMPAQLIDVNVHPAKTEVRFAHDNQVFDAIYGAVKQGLMPKFVADEPQDLEANQELMPNHTLGEPQGLEMNQELIQKNTANEPQNISVKEMPFTHTTSYSKNTFNADEKLGLNSYFDALLKTEVTESNLASPSPIAYDISGNSNIIVAIPTTNSAKEDSFTPPTSEENISEQTIFYKENTVPAVKYIGEVFKTYILVEHDNELCLIDKHAAHERILYEQLLSSYGEPAFQTLLEPISVLLGAAEKNALLENIDILLAAGIEAEDFGGCSVLIRSVPSDVVVSSVHSLVEELASKMVLNRKDNQSEKTSWVLHSIACRAAIKGGDSTHNVELFALVENIISGKTPPFCPHGRPIIIRYTRKELEKQFGRQG